MKDTRGTLIISELLQESKEINGLKPNAKMNDFFVTQFAIMCAEKACEEQRANCTAKYLMANGSDMDAEISAIENAPQPEFQSIKTEKK